jgi:hypothetical protein
MLYTLDVVLLIVGLAAMAVALLAARMRSGRVLY